jgi:hypothetical protein
MVLLFQQDGATAHTAKITVTFLQDFFGNHIVEHGFWPLIPIPYTTLLLSLGIY